MEMSSARGAIRTIMVLGFILVISASDTNVTDISNDIDVMESDVTGNDVSNNDSVTQIYTTRDVNTEITAVEIVTESGINALTAGADYSLTVVTDNSSVNLTTQIIPTEVLLGLGESTTLHVLMNVTGLTTNYSDIHVLAQSRKNSMAKVVSITEVTQIGVDAAEASVVVEGGSNLGKTQIILSQRLVTNNSYVILGEEVVQVMVKRAAHRAHTQTVLEYISITLGMTMMLFLGCNSSVYDLKRSWLWILVTLAIQVVMVPLVSINLLVIGPCFLDI